MKRKMMLILGVMLFTTLSCDKEKLNPNEVYSSKDLKIEFRDFTDSRCPQNVNCIWAGEAEVFLKATSGDESIAFSLKGLGADTVLFGHTIEFVDLLPYPEAGVEQSFEDEEVILNVTEL
ncbi:MAG: hypothetical protein HYZ14_05790 [Bacteroidetes bacterium]|nr:hypothetical protein [Bacteroidota bacterium]